MQETQETREPEETREPQPAPEMPALPENVTGPRIIAALIDTVVLAISFVVLSIVMGEAETAGGTFSVSLDGLPALLFFLLALAYYVVPEATTGKTPGKAIMGLKVVKLDGSSYTMGSALGRNVLRIIDVLPVLYLLGFIVVAVSKHNQRLGDMAAGTVVVRG